MALCCLNTTLIPQHYIDTYYRMFLQNSEPVKHTTLLQENNVLYVGAIIPGPVSFPWAFESLIGFSTILKATCFMCTKIYQSVVCHAHALPWYWLQCILATSVLLIGSIVHDYENFCTNWPLLLCKPFGTIIWPILRKIALTIVPTLISSDFILVFSRFTLPSACFKDSICERWNKSTLAGYQITFQKWNYQKLNVRLKGTYLTRLIQHMIHNYLFHKNFGLKIHHFSFHFILST